MSRKTVQTTLASAVATNGTFAVGYPTGYSKGDFALGHKHQMVALQSLYKAPKDMTLSFGATSVTVTWKGTTTLPANSTIFFGFDIGGPDSYADTDWEQRRNVSFRPGQLVLLNLGSPAAAATTVLISAATGAELTTTTAGSTTFTFATQGGSSPLDGTYSNGVPDVPRNITITATHGSSVPAFTATITSYNKAGDLQVETLTTTGATASVTLTGTKAHAKLVSATFTENGNGAGFTSATISMGVGSKLGLDFPILAKNLVAVNTLANPSIGTLHVSIVGSQTNGDGTTVAGFDVTVATAATIGSTTVAAATEGDASQQVSEGSQIVIAPGAGFTTGSALAGSIIVRPTNTLRGTLVVADTTTTPTGTTGDVLGTYTPAFTLDGSASIQLWVFAPDTQSHGTPNYTG